jgi:CheY-like chemotaxis protein
VKLDPEQLEKFKAFIQSGKTMIVDTSASSRQRMASILSMMGARASDMLLVSSYDDAQEIMKSVTPKLILCDYMLDGKPGLDLLQMRRARDQESKGCLYALVTGNSSQSLVAQAAEEDVDTFILKPYTIDSFQKILLQAVIQKIHPSQYVMTIEEGKQFLSTGDFPRAQKCFEHAMTLEPKPALACFYLGQLKMVQGALDLASNEFQTGLQFNGIHYKCLVGLYENLIKQNRLKDAYFVVRRLARFFPANPSRLSEVIALAIKTNHFDDMNEYYDIFKAMETRTDRLVDHVCAGLNVYGKLKLIHGEVETGIKLFDQTSVSCAGRTKFLRYIIETLVQYEQGVQAEQYLVRFPLHEREGLNYLVSEYLVQSLSEDADRMVHLGRSILSRNAGYGDPRLYSVLIEAMLDRGMNDEAEEAMRKAISQYPEQRENFEGIFVSKLFKDVS